MKTNTQMRLLWLSVIKQAINDTEEFRLSLCTPAVKWLLLDDVDFPEICQLAGIDGNDLRKKILSRLAVPAEMA
jgi:hypothetical protein